VATSVGLGVLGIGQMMTEFLVKYPELKVDLNLSDRVTTHAFPHTADRREPTG
jgi:hypothetical protein